MTCTIAVLSQVSKLQPDAQFSHCSACWPLGAITTTYQWAPYTASEPHVHHHSTMCTDYSQMWTLASWHTPLACLSTQPKVATTSDVWVKEESFKTRSILCIYVWRWIVWDLSCWMPQVLSRITCSGCDHTSYNQSDLSCNPRVSSRLHFSVDRERIHESISCFSSYTASFSFCRF